MEFDTLKDWARADWEAHADWRECAQDDFAFMAGHQYTDEEEQLLRETNRAPVVFNRVATIINAVAGSEINNRTEVRYIPRGIGDAEPNEVYTKAAEWFRDQGGAEEQDSAAFFDALVCGVGWTETRLDFDGDPEGQPVVERVEPWEMAWDANARKKGLTEARRVMRARRIPIAIAREMFPGVDDEMLSADWLPYDEGGVSVRSGGDDYATDSDDVPDDGLVTVIQMQWREKVKFTEFVDPATGKRAEMTNAEFGKIRKVIDTLGVELVKNEFTRYEYKQAFLGGDILGEITSPRKNGFTFTPITGYWDAKKKQWYGLLRSMRDPQKYANKWLSQTLHIINSNAKGGVMVETDAVDSPRTFEETWAAADSVNWVRPGRVSGIVPKPQVQFPVALMQLTEFALVSIRDASGVNQELLGLSEHNQPGVLEYQRKQQAMTTLAVLFDSLRFYRKRQGEIFLDYIQDYLADGRLVRIVGDDGAKYVPLTKDPQVRKYDVIVDDAPTAPNQKEKVWGTIRDMLPILAGMELGAEVWAEIIEYAPFPASLIEKLKAKATEGQENPQAAQAAQIAMAQAMADVDKTKSETAENQAQAALTAAKAQMEPMQAQARMRAAMQPRMNIPR